MAEAFSHLRVSSEYSISQGLLTIDQIIQNAIKHSIPSVALTDKSNMFGLVKFFQKCESNGIKPISGSSINVIFDSDDMSHELLCLAKSNEGHKNLMKLISHAHNNYSYNNPIISFSDLKNLFYSKLLDLHQILLLQERLFQKLLLKNQKLKKTLLIIQTLL